MLLVIWSAMLSGVQGEFGGNFSRIKSSLGSWILAVILTDFGDSLRRDRNDSDVVERTRESSRAGVLDVVNERRAINKRQGQKSDCGTSLSSK